MTIDEALRLADEVTPAPAAAHEALLLLRAELKELLKLDLAARTSIRPEAVTAALNAYRFVLATDSGIYDAINREQVYRRAMSDAIQAASSANRRFDPC